MFSLLSPGEENTSHSVAQPAQVVSKESHPDICAVVCELPPAFTPRLSITITKAKLLLAFVGKTLWEHLGELVGIALIV